MAGVAQRLFLLASGVAKDSEGLAASHTDTVIAYMDDAGADAVLEVMMALSALLPVTPAPHLLTPFVVAAARSTKRRAALRAMLVTVATASCAAARDNNDAPPPSLRWTLERVLELRRCDRLWCADEEEAIALRRACDVAVSTTQDAGDAVEATRTAALCRAVRRTVLCERVAPSGALAAMRAAACPAAVRRLAAACHARGVTPGQRASSARSGGTAGAGSSADPRTGGERTDGSADVDSAAVCASFTHACVSLLGRLHHHASALDRRATRFRGPRFRDAARTLADAVCTSTRGIRSNSTGSTAPSREELGRLTSGVDFSAVELLGALSGGACEPAAAQPLTAAFALLLLARVQLQLLAPSAELAVLGDVLPTWTHFVCSPLPAPSDSAAAATAGTTAAGGAAGAAADDDAAAAATTAASHAAARHALLCWFALFCVDLATPAQLAAAAVGDALRCAAARERSAAPAAAPPSDACLLLELCARLATEAAS